MSCVEGELRYKPLSPYAAVKRDLALVCDEAVACGDIEETIKKASPHHGGQAVRYLSRRKPWRGQEEHGFLSDPL